MNSALCDSAPDFASILDEDVVDDGGFVLVLDLSVAC